MDTSLTIVWKFYLYSVLLIIPVNLICHMTMLEKYIFDPLGTLEPQSPPLASERERDFWLVLLLYVPSQQLWSLRDGQFT